jgi:hypothetical protein
MCHEGAITILTAKGSPRTDRLDLHVGGGSCSRTQGTLETIDDHNPPPAASPSASEPFLSIGPLGT